MNWPPTKTDMLRLLDGAAEGIRKVAYGFEAEGKGLAIYDPESISTLIDDGLVRKLPVPISGAACLTEMGKEAVQMLKGERTVSKFAMPDWLLVELTRVPPDTEETQR